MTGTQKQIEWAEKIKAEKIAALNQRRADIADDEKDGFAGKDEIEYAALIDQAIPKISAIESAAAWIDLRSLPTDLLIGAAIGQYPTTKKFAQGSDIDSLLCVAAKAFGTIAQWINR